jgi:RimJ/RimL family protein N-acetyltransferase
VEADGDVCLVWAPAHGGPTAGSFALDAIDWPAGRALLVAALAPGADAALMHEALGLVVGYAATELGLERIEARLRADDRATRETLAALGFAEEERLTAGWRDPEPVDVALMARIRRVGNG